MITHESREGITVDPRFVAVAAMTGLAAGPTLAAWSHRATGPLGLFAPGWWRGAGVPVGHLGMVTGLAALLFTAFAVRFAGSVTLPAWCWLGTTGIVLAVEDMRQRRLPHVMTFAMAAGGLTLLSVAAAVENRWGQLVFAVLAGIVVLAAAAVVQVAFPAHTGGGDTMLYGALALYLGWFGWTGLVHGLLLATGLTAVVAIAVWARRRRASATFPAGPSLIAGTILAVLVA